MRTEDFKKDISLAQYTTFKVGGPAKFLFEAKTEQGLVDALKCAKDSSLPYLVLGSGSNVLIGDKGFEGLVIINKTKGIEVASESIHVASGEILKAVVGVSVDNGLYGLHKLDWIPGTVGGAVAGNAGAYGQEIGELVEKVTAWDSKKDEKVEFTKNECDFKYRSSIFKVGNANLRSLRTILSVDLKLESGRAAEVQQEAKEINKKRKVSLPKLPSCGCDFKNFNQGEFDSDVIQKLSKLDPKTEEVIQKSHGKLPVGFIVEALGLKGKSVGGAKVSDEHGNIIVNAGNATAKDIKDLINLVQSKVKEELGLELQLEIQFIGEFN